MTKLLYKKQIQLCLRTNLIYNTANYVVTDDESNNKSTTTTNP